MLESDNVSKYFVRVLTIYNQIKRCGKNIYGRDTCGRKDHKVVAKEVPLYGGRDRGVTKYGCSFNPRSHGKITSL